MECPNCEHHPMVATTQDIPFTYKGETIVIRDVGGDHCSLCDEFILDSEESKRIDVILRKFVSGVNARSLDPGFIKDVRKKLGLKQHEAGQIFGGGPNAFSRYETGKAAPPVAVVKLLKLLDRHPEFLPEVR